MQAMFPSETAGDGRIRRQYLRDRDGQGNGLKLRRVACKNCGFPGCDLVRHDHSGGSLDGSGAGGAITQQGSGADANQAYNSGGGCPLCYSKNFYGSRRRRDEFSRTPFYIDRLA